MKMKLNPVLVTTKKDEDDMEKKSKKSRKAPKINIKTKDEKETTSKVAKGKAAKPSKAPKRARGNTASAGFVDFYAKPRTPSKADYSSEAYVSDAIYASALKRFNKAHNAKTIARSINSSVDPDHKKAVTAVSSDIATTVVQQQLAKVAPKVDRMVAAAVKLVASSKMDKTTLANMITNVGDLFGAETPKKKKK